MRFEDSGLKVPSWPVHSAPTLRLKLLKVGVRVKITMRRVWLSYAQSYPYAEIFTRVLENLQRQALWDPSG